MNEKNIPESRLKNSFDKWWPDFDSALKNWPGDSLQSKDREQRRSQEDMISEILEHVREIKILSARKTILSAIPGSAIFEASPSERSRLKDFINKNYLLLLFDRMGKYKDEDLSSIIEKWTAQDLEKLNPSRPKKIVPTMQIQPTQKSRAADLPRCDFYKNEGGS